MLFHFRHIGVLIHKYFLFCFVLFVCLFVCLFPQVIEDFSYELGWLFQMLVGLGIVNVNHEIRENLKKDISALRHYLETKEVTTNKTELTVNLDGALN